MGRLREFFRSMFKSETIQEARQGLPPWPDPPPPSSHVDQDGNPVVRSLWISKAEKDNPWDPECARVREVQNGWLRCCISHTSGSGRDGTMPISRFLVLYEPDLNPFHKGRI